MFRLKYPQLQLNLLANVLNFIFSVLVGFWLVPYLIRNLGISAYGLIPLATTLTAYMAVFTLALNSAVGRFLTMALDRRDAAESNRIFNTSFWGSIVILFAMAAPSFWFAWHADSFLDVPSGLENDFTGLLLAIIGMFYLTTLTSAFNVATFCRNRFDLANIVHILSTITRVTIIVMLFNICAPQVWQVGTAYLVAAIIAGIGAILLWRILTPELKVCLSCFSMSTLRMMTSFGWWVVVSQVGTILYLSVDLIVVNKMIGIVATGQYGALMIWSALLRNFSMVVSGIFAPTVFILFSRNKFDELLGYSRRALKFTGLIIALPVGLICGFSKPLLLLWLGEAFVPLAPLMVLMTLHLGFNLSVSSISHLYYAANKVRLPGIVTCIMGLINLGLAIALAGPVGWGMYGVAVAGAIMLTVRNLFFIPIYSAKILGLKWTAFYREMIPAFAVSLTLAAIGWGIVFFCGIESWLALIISGMILFSVSIVAIYVIILNRHERLQAMRMIFPLMTKPAR